MEESMKLSGKIFMAVLLVVLFSLAIACTKKQSSSAGANTTVVGGREVVGNVFVTGYPIANGPLTLKIMTFPHYQDQFVNDYSKKPFVPIAERETGITIEWITSTGQALPAILASNDLPDAFIGGVGDSLLVQNTNLFLPLEDKMEKWLPDLLKLYQEKIPGWQRFLTVEGHIYCLMANFYQSLPHTVDSMSFVNTNWLSAIGKPVPTTVIEFRDMLRAFKTQNVGNPGGQNEKIPLNFSFNPPNASILHYMGAWGVQRNNYNLNNGRISGSVNSANYREYLEFMHSLVAEGLVNVEGFSASREQYTAQLQTLNTGVFQGWGPGNFITNRDHLTMWEWIPPPTVPGKENLRILHGSPARINSARNGFLVASSSKNQEAAMRWWNYLSKDQDMAMLVVHGEPGVGYIKRGENDYMQIMPTPEQLAKYGISSLGDFFPTIGLVAQHPVVLKYPALDIDNAKYSENYWRELYLPRWWDFLQKEWVPQSIVRSDKTEERVLIEVDMNPFIDQFRAEAVMNGVTDASWNAYVRDLETRFRYNDWLKWYQDYVDGKF
jgi:putative aldouronate transport system substrate-binding protein